MFEACVFLLDWASKSALLLALGFQDVPPIFEAHPRVYFLASFEHPRVYSCLLGFQDVPPIFEAHPRVYILACIEHACLQGASEGVFSLDGFSGRVGGFRDASHKRGVASCNASEERRLRRDDAGHHAALR